jgi:deoxyribodipyrimidine photo-lyase
MQMQSGTTGINTLRIYSPAKQALDHDPHGLYIRQWVPEFGSDAYPPPIVDERTALRAAKERLYGIRRTGQARAEADAIQDKHGSRKSGLPRTAAGARPRRVTTAGQGSLF